MEFLTFIGGIVILFLVLNVRGRVQKLEQMVKSGAAKIAPEPSRETIPSQPPTQQLQMSGELLDYIRQQLRQGASREEIKSTLMSNGRVLSDIDNAFNSIIATVPKSATIPPTEPTGPTASERFVAWLKEDWLMKLGAMLLLIGFGWLTTYAFLSNWIGPMGRIALGIVAPVLFLSFSDGGESKSMFIKVVCFWFLVQPRFCLPFLPRARFMIFSLHSPL